MADVDIAGQIAAVGAAAEWLRRTGTDEHATVIRALEAAAGTLAEQSRPLPEGLETTAEERAQWLAVDHWYPSLRHCMEACCRDIDRLISRAPVREAEIAAADATVAEGFSAMRQAVLAVEYEVNAKHGGDATVQDFVPVICRHIAAAIRARTGIPSPVRGEWQPIETVPKDGDDFLACLWGTERIVVSYELPAESAPDHCWRTLDGPTYHKDALTSWMRLPAAPPVPKEPGNG